MFTSAEKRLYYAVGFHKRLYMAFQKRPRIKRKRLWQLFKIVSEYDDKTIESFIRTLQKNDKIEKDYSDGQLTISSKNEKEIRTLDDLIVACDIDLDQWKITRHIINEWPTTAKDNEGNLTYRQNFQVKAWLEPKTEDTNLETHIESFIDRLESLSPEVSPITYPKKDEPCLAEISIFDIHFGKLAWERETGENYDSKIAQERSMAAFNDLLERALRNDIEEFLIVIGNDELHIDSMQEETTAGTPQHTDSRWQQMADRVIETRIKQIDTAKQYAPVNILIVPGNHDEMLAQWIGRELRAYYRNDANVNVNAEPTLTKYYKYGVNMLMFNHGKDVKPDRLANMMPVQKPQMFAETEVREVHIGHLHKRAKMVRHVDEDAGVVVRVLPSLCGSDYWHAKKLFTGNIKAAQCYIWGKDSGLEDIYQHNEL